MSVNRVYQFLKILSKLEDNELDMTYRVLLAFADSRGIRMDAKEKVNFDRERKEAETAEAAPKKSGNTRLPYALCKQAGIDTTGFTPSECWAAYGHEQEYLLARGAHFEPTKVEIKRDSSGTIINMFVDLDLIAQD